MKRWFISTYLMLLGALVVIAGYGLLQDRIAWGPAGMLLAAAAPLVFFAWLLLARPARTDAHPILVSVLSGLGAVIAMSAEYRFGPTAMPWLVGATLALAGWLAYVTWYSRQPHAPGAPVPGQTLPAFELVDAEARTVSSDSLRGHKAVLLFYRGNWCPLCVAQIHELAAAWRKVARFGAKVWFISSQSQKQTREIASKFSIPADFLRDPDNRAARALGIDAPGATPAGMELLGYPPDAALPTVIVIDEDGIVRFVEVAANYRLRPDPESYLRYLMPDVD
jgi:peroxiredoxin